NSARSSSGPFVCRALRVVFALVGAAWDAAFAAVFLLLILICPFVRTYTKFDAGPASSGDYALMIDPHAAPHLREYQMLSALNSEFRIHKNIAINAETTMRDCILTLAQIVESRARLTPSRIVARDLTRSLTC